MILIYVQTLLMNKDEDEKTTILRKVVPPTSHYSIMQASRFALVYSVVKYIFYGSKINGVIQSAMMKNWRSVIRGLIALSSYGTVQHAADSANNLKYFLPQFYDALYAQNLEMMYFIIEPLVLDVGYLNISTASNAEIIDALKRMAG
jgi:L-rhamnose mutarotase